MKITKYKTYLFRTVKKKLNLSLSKNHATLDFNFFDNTNKIEVKGKHYVYKVAAKHTCWSSCKF
jgi:hypothetical protein